jgi:hypothetical protein
MQYEALDHGKDEKNNWWGQPHLRSENKDEVTVLQKILLTEEEVMIIPKSVYTMISKHGAEVIEFLSEKYPEDLLSEEMQQAAEHLKSLNEKR